MDAQRYSGTQAEIAGPEVPEKPVRRRFRAEDKLRILAEADARTERGALGELLRREGLYSSHLSKWRKRRNEGVPAGLTPKRRGQKAKPKNPLADEVGRLERENERLKTKLRQAELIRVVSLSVVCRTARSKGSHGALYHLHKTHNL